MIWQQITESKRKCKHRVLTVWKGNKYLPSVLLLSERVFVTQQYGSLIYANLRLQGATTTSSERWAPEMANGTIFHIRLSTEVMTPLSYCSSIFVISWNQFSCSCSHHHLHKQTHLREQGLECGSSHSVELAPTETAPSRNAGLFQSCWRGTCSCRPENSNIYCCLFLLWWSLTCVLNIILVYILVHFRGKCCGVTYPAYIYLADTVLALWALQRFSSHKYGTVFIANCLPITILHIFLICTLMLLSFIRS